MPKVTHTTRQSALEAHSLCITLWLGTASHNLPSYFSTASPYTLSSLFLHISLMSQTYLVLCHLQNFPYVIPQLWDPVYFLKSIVPQGSAVSMSPLNSYCPLLLPTRLFYCYPRSVPHSAFLYLVLPPHLPQLYVTWGQELCVWCFRFLPLLSPNAIGWMAYTT